MFKKICRSSKVRNDKVGIPMVKRIEWEFQCLKG